MEKQIDHQFSNVLMPFIDLESYAINLHVYSKEIWLPNKNATRFKGINFGIHGILTISKWKVTGFHDISEKAVVFNHMTTHAQLFLKPSTCTFRHI